MSNNIRVRFAPSPTGPLHIGGARTALFNYLFAKCTGGKFILRIDDTDTERSTKENEADILASLKWLGLAWDEGPGIADGDTQYYQSNRIKRHVDVANQLLESGKAYKDHEGVVRIKYPEGPIIVHDLILGDCSFETTVLGPDPVILRSDGRPTYHLASCVDDADFGITHVIRGQDHLTNTTKHIVLFDAMGVSCPAFAHLPLILGMDGSKLSKRNSDGLTVVSEFKNLGYVPEALINFLMLLGWSHPEEKEILSLEEVITLFKIERFNPTPAKFETPKLNHLNGWWIRHLEVGRIAKDSLDYLGDYRELVNSKSSSFWPSLVESFRSSFVFLSDAKKIAKLVFDLEIHLEPSIDKAEFIPFVKEWRDYLSNLMLEDGSDCPSTAQFKDFLKPFKKNKEVSQKSLFHALRLAITGELSGPDLSILVSYIQRDTLLQRADSFLR